MVNKGRIQRELGKFLMISLNLIKSDDELMVEIEENGRFKTIPRNPKSSNLTLLSQKN